MGPSGGGKTSIVKLVQRFYVPDAGAVLLDGRDVGAYDPRWLKRRVALVAQVAKAPVLAALACACHGQRMRGARLASTRIRCCEGGQPGRGARRGLRLGGSC